MQKKLLRSFTYLHPIIFFVFFFFLSEGSKQNNAINDIGFQRRQPQHPKLEVQTPLSLRNVVYAGYFANLKYSDEKRYSGKIIFIIFIIFIFKLDRGSWAGVKFSHQFRVKKDTLWSRRDTHTLMPVLKNLPDITVVVMGPDMCKYCWPENLTLKLSALTLLDVPPQCQVPIPQS